MVTDRVTIATRVVQITVVRTDGGELGTWQPGAHVDVHVPGGYVRQYSLCGDPDDRSRWKIAVLRVEGGRGGSCAVHDSLVPGARVELGGPRNNFPLVDAPRYVFVAGGIGITPILPMVELVERRQRPWRLLYLARDRAAMAFRERIGATGAAATLWCDAELGICDVASWLSLPEVGASRNGAAVYCCGPEPLLGTVEQLARAWPARALHLERFSSTAVGAGADRPLEVELRRSGLTVEVPAGCSILEAVERAGIFVLSSCREGTCGTCETDVLDGLPEHRDTVLDRDAREAGDIMMICVSRSLSPRLVLDL
ncbi:MAG TPA: PDR/VanB family oxidoreductase [Acidimicrobiales bacterium]|nr:PDR/VanB family oxidoreductase [Acidimicrobiales bacterium]